MTMRTQVAVVIILGAALIATLAILRVSRDHPATPGPILEGTRPWFTDVTAESRLDHVNVSGEPGQFQIIDQNGQGAAIFDYNADGRMDIYIANGSTIAQRRVKQNPGGRLYRNHGDGTFADVTEEAGVSANEWGLGAAAADIDADGDPDLYLTNWGPNTLFRNDGDGTFTDVTAEAGVGHTAYSSSAAFGDVDADGDLDLYVSNYVFVDPDVVPDKERDGTPCLYKGIVTGCGPWVFDGERDALYRNRGDGTFEDVTVEAGLEASDGYRGFPVLLIDLDLDNDLDAYVGCDVMPNLYLLNDGSGRFAPAPVEWGGTVNGEGNHESGMGVGAGDVDGDGDLDLFTTNFAFQTNTLYENVGGLMVDRTDGSGLEAHPEEMGWANALADLDNDGLLDAFVSNGHIYPQVESLEDPLETYNQRMRLYPGVGGLQFREAGSEDGWRPAPIHSNRGFALGDLDNDGDLDIVIVRHRERASIWRNETGGRFLTITLRGKPPNTDGIGARVRLRADGRDQWAFAAPYQSYQSSHDPRIHFGLGAAERIERIEVHWPSGTVDHLEGIEPNQFLTIDEGGT